MNIKLRHFLFLFLPILSYGQNCDTLYSHEKYVERKIEIEYRNCHSLEIDSIYRIVQWLNVDSNYLVPFFSENICQSLYHSITGKLIHERWEMNDTTYFKSYYSSGNLKSYTKTVGSDEPYYFHVQIVNFYESGQVKYKGEYKSSSFSIHRSFYESGSLESIAKRFSYNPNPFGEYIEYFPNGQISMTQLFSEPDTTINRYQSSNLLSEKFYNEFGDEVDHNLNEYKKLYLSIYPPIIDETLIIDERYYTSQQFEGQDAYANEMLELKERITKHLDLSNSTCTKGIAWISLNILKNGKIELLEVEFENEALKRSIEESIDKIKKWPAAIKNGKKVDTHIYTYLIIDK